MSIRVVIADDHALVRDGLRYRIENSRHKIEIVAEAASGAEVLEIAATKQVDVFVLDIAMPQLNGLETARELARKCPDAKIIILSFHSSFAMVAEALHAGVHGYLTKSVVGGDVVEAIRAVQAGHFYLSADVTRYVVENAMRVEDPSRSTLNAGNRLSPQERKVLQRIAEGQTAKQIAAEMGLATYTVQTHRKSLMRKLDIHKQTDLVRFAVKEGITEL